MKRGALLPAAKARAVAMAMVLLLAAGCAPRGSQHPRVVRLPPPRPLPTFYVPAGGHTEWSRMAEIAPRARRRWRPSFARAGAPYPPATVVLAAFKRERRLDVYAGFAPYRLKYVRSIRVTAASGGPGPKLRRGDLQVPEGVYRVEALNPNSDYHVSLRLDYPNVHDQLMALREGRSNLGGDIMIHGSNRSIGCLAVGDEAAEDLFVLASDAGIHNVSVWIAPRDFRRTGERWAPPGAAPWVTDLYTDLDRRLRMLPAPARPRPAAARAATSPPAPVAHDRAR